MGAQELVKPRGARCGERVQAAASSAHVARGDGAPQHPVGFFSAKTAHWMDCHVSNIPRQNPIH